MSVDPQEFARGQVEALREREDMWSGWRERTQMVRQLASGDWAPVFGSDEDRVIGNLPRKTIEDDGRMFAEAMPSARCDSDGPDGEARAEKREMALAAYDNGSDLDASMELFGEDLIAAGLTGIKTWPDFNVPIQKRFPVFERVDPQTILPEPRWAPHRPSDNVMLHYRRPLAQLRREFPAQVQSLLDRIGMDNRERVLASRGYYDLSEQNVQAAPVELEMIDWYSSTFVSRVCMWRTEREDYAEVLLAESNPTGICPVQLVARPTWLNEPKGQIDDAKGALRTQNRLWRMIVDYFIEMVYGPIIAWNIRNPGARGAGAVLQALGPDAKYDRVGAANISFQAFGVVDQMEDHARSDMVALKSREGQLELNKATAAFLTGSGAQQNSVVKSLQRAFQTGKRHANEAAFAQDEAWCNAPDKQITGKLRGRRFRTTYTPKVDIAGDYSNRVSYGTSSGLDQPTDQVLRLQKLGRTMDVETFLENDPGIEDVPTVMGRLRRDAMEQSILAGLSMPTTPLGVRARAWRAFNENSEDFDKVVDEIDAALQAPAPAAAPPGGPPVLPGTAPANVPTRPGVAGAEAPMLPPFEALQRVATRRR